MITSPISIPGSIPPATPENNKNWQSNFSISKVDTTAALTLPNPLCTKINSCFSCVPL